MTLNDLLLFGARKLPLRALRQSAFRKFCRRNVGRSLDVRCRGGFGMRTIIGDSVDNNIAVHGIFEVGTTHVIETLSKQSESFLDVGCNIGYYACLFGAGNPHKRLVAVDPNPVMTERTRANLEEAGSSPKEIFDLPVLRDFDVYLIEDAEGGYIQAVDPARLTQGERINANVLLVKSDEQTRAALKRSQVSIR